MQILNEYPPGAAFNACIICRSSIRPGVYTDDNEPDRVVDTGVTLDMEGHVCICSTCWKIGASLLGWGPDTSGMGVENRRLGRALQASKVREDKFRRLLAEAVNVVEEREADDRASS